MTCNNAANNDVMIQEMAHLTDGFVGSVAHSCCFLHIINLVAKSLLRQFDAKRKDRVSDSNKSDTDTEWGLGELLVGLEALTVEGDGDDLAADGDEGGEDDSEEGWIDEVAEMTDREHCTLERNVVPVKFTLAKVRVPKKHLEWF